MFHANFLGEKGNELYFQGHHWKEQTFLHKTHRTVLCLKYFWDAINKENKISVTSNYAND